jgi:hypothetical protein
MGTPDRPWEAVMKRIGFLATIALAFTAVLAQAPAHAQQPRTFVSPTGSDNNPCTLASPCRTFQGAIAQTNAGGEIGVLGTAGYNGGATFNIDRPISIVNPGGFEAGIVVPSGGYGITFSTSGAVYLRGLTIEGNGVGQEGIFYSGVAGSLTIQQCVVRMAPVSTTSRTRRATSPCRTPILPIASGPGFMSDRPARAP